MVIPNIDFHTHQNCTNFVGGFVLFLFFADVSIILLHSTGYASIYQVIFDDSEYIMRLFLI